MVLLITNDDDGEDEDDDDDDDYYCHMFRFMLVSFGMKEDLKCCFSLILTPLKVF